MNETLFTAIIAGLVPAVAYVVTTMASTRRNSEDIKDLKLDMKGFTAGLQEFSNRLGNVEKDVAVIRSICQQRSDHYRD
jgi:hypothetical protein